MDVRELFRHIPPVDEILSQPSLAQALARHGRALVLEEVRRGLEALRADVRLGRALADPDEIARAPAQVAAQAAASLETRAAGRLVEVLNATGVIVHTNLGRAPLGQPALDRLVGRGAAVNLEVDLETGRRGPRAAGVDELLRSLTGAEAACVVNNNAAALLLALETLARGGPVVVSRGELVEIGGAFRIPDVCARAGVRLVEVGTTNRTRASDYAEALDAIGAGTRTVILKVHPSNFRVVGFTEEASVEDLVALGRKRGVQVVMDQGSGALRDLSPWGIEGERPVPSIVDAGADLVLFSGDKLLGGPQAGCLVGRRAAVEACRKNPLYRALRPGRLVLAALEATLWSHASGHLDEVPVLAQVLMPVEDVRARAQALQSELSRRSPSIVVGVEDGFSTSGGGSSPTSRIATSLVRVAGPPPDTLAHALRMGLPPVFTRIEGDAVLLDLRTVPPERDGDIAGAVAAALERVAVR